MKKIILCIICILFVTASASSQNGTQLIYNSGNYGITVFNTVKPTGGIKRILIQLGLYNISSGNNSSGSYFTLNKNTGAWYLPYNGFINAAWGHEFPYGTLECKPIPSFAVSRNDTNFIYKYVVTPGASCPDADSYYTTNGGATYSQAPFGCGGVILFPAGADYNPKKANEILLGFRQLYYPGGYDINLSTNGGVNWIVISNICDLREQSSSYMIQYNQYGFLKYNPFDTAFVYANGMNEIFVSTNGGYHFDTIDVKWMKDIVFSYKDSALYGYNDFRLYRSTNKGLLWDSIVTQVKFSSLEINPDNANILYGGDSLGVHISTNRGGNWSLYNNSFSPSKVVIGLSKDPGTLDTFYAVTTKNVYKVWAGFIVGSENGSQNIPVAFSLSQNYPNPFNPVTKIKFEIPENGKSKIGNGIVSLKIYDLLGKEIETLVNESLMPGTYEAEFDGSNYPSGIYFYKLSAGNFTQTKKLILLK